MRGWICLMLWLLGGGALAQVNVFLGTSGDHGQMSPGAGTPFGLLSISPHTYPTTHAGYEHKAIKTLGFTHNRMEGTGCQGSGGILLLKPFIADPNERFLHKEKEQAGPGYYSARYREGIRTRIDVNGNEGKHAISFQKGVETGYVLNLAHAINNGFVRAEHRIEGNSIKGWVDARTTCHAGVFRTYFTIRSTQDLRFEVEGNRIVARAGKQEKLDLQVRLSSVAESYTEPLGIQSGEAVWKKYMEKFKLKGEEQGLFYSLWYRTLQSPYLISEADGAYRTIQGARKNTEGKRYNGWAIWDNFKTQLPFLSLFYPEEYQDMVTSIAEMYRYGKKDFSTKTEPSNTVRTEHAVVVLLDAYRKGYKVDFEVILDSLVAEAERLPYATPDKALESAYDTWALSKIGEILGRTDIQAKYREKTLQYKANWVRNFKDLRVRDADQMSARKMYQGTIWQYRWSVPFDVKGLQEMVGPDFMHELDRFFEEDFFNRANQPDLQSPLLYNATSAPWKAQKWIYTFAKEPVNNFYFNDNSKGIYAEITRIFKNEPQAFVRTMDNDAGSMSGWYLLSALGLHPALVGEPIYYLNAPLFRSVEIALPGGAKLNIKAPKQNGKHPYVQSVKLNGKILERNWVRHEEIAQGAHLEIITSTEPNKQWGTENQWISSYE